MRSHEGARRDTELPLEQASEVRLIGEAGAQGDVGEGGTRRVEETPGTLEAQRHQMLVRRAAHRLLERAREMCQRESGLAREDVERELSVRLRIHQLEHTSSNDRREAAARRLGVMLGYARLLHDLQCESGGESVHERETGRRPGAGFCREGGEQVSHLRPTDAVRSA
jgi:hypothetical protein